MKSGYLVLSSDSFIRISYIICINYKRNVWRYFIYLTCNIEHHITVTMVDNLSTIICQSRTQDQVGYQNVRVIHTRNSTSLVLYLAWQCRGWGPDDSVSCCADRPCSPRGYVWQPGGAHPGLALDHWAGRSGSGSNQEHLLLTKDNFIKPPLKTNNCPLMFFQYLKFYQCSARP